MWSSPSLPWLRYSSCFFFSSSCFLLCSSTASCLLFSASAARSSLVKNLGYNSEREYLQLNFQKSIICWSDLEVLTTCTYILNRLSLTWYLKFLIDISFFLSPIEFFEITGFDCNCTCWKTNEIVILSLIVGTVLPIPHPVSTNSQQYYSLQVSDSHIIFNFLSLFTPP